jgi:hypothetical protein
MKAKSMVDWRGQVKRHPLGMLGVAAGGGALVAVMTSRRRGKSAEPARVASAESSTPRELGSILMAVVTAATVELLTQAVPRLATRFGKKISGSPATDGRLH